MTRPVKIVLRVLGIGFLLCVLTLVVFIVNIRAIKHHLRRNWKEQAIHEIAAMADSQTWVDKQSAILFPKGYTVAPRDEAWLTDGMILMRSGEWLAYRNHCNKETPHLVDDICLVKASNGRWDYTTCHFCVGMVALGMMQDEKPKDLASFVDHYQFREFDGTPDDCLQPTKTFPDDIELGQVSNRQ